MILKLFVLLLVVTVGQQVTEYDYQSPTAFHNVLLGMNKDPLEHMNISYPKLAMIPWNEIDNCYVAEIGSRDINIFNITIGEVITEYFRENYDLIDSDNVAQGIKSLVSNLGELIEMIYDCVHKKDTKMKFGLTSLSHYSYEEYKSYLNPYLSNLTHELRADDVNCNMEETDDIPNEYNWLDQGKVSIVKNQGTCGSCYIFSAVGALESQYYIHKNQSADFGEQSLLNCLSSGCNGGMMDKVWNYISNHGVPDASDDKYSGRPHTCTEYTSSGSITSYCWHRFNGKELDDYQITALLHKYGPTVSAMDAESRELRYIKDIFDGKCTHKVNHAILIVGYSSDYWVIKNSWGSRFGKKGFFRMPRLQNKCGINYISGVPFIE